MCFLPTGNNHIALEDYSVMQGQAHNVDDLGAPHLALGDLGDDLVAHFYRWKASAEGNDRALPFFSKRDGNAMNFKATATGDEMSQHATFSVVDDRERADENQVGTYGILKLYTQQTPTDLYPPVNYQMYKPMDDLDQAFRPEAPGNECQQEKHDKKVVIVVAASMVGMLLAGAAVAQSMELLHL